MAGAERPQGPLSRADAGARAESVAALFLEARGLTIVARNFRTRRGEIDIIARDGATLVFVEVRLRRSQSFGGAGASITSARA
jgi:putative endonuclease